MITRIDNQITIKERERLEFIQTVQTRSILIEKYVEVRVKQYNGCTLTKSKFGKGLYFS